MKRSSHHPPKLASLLRVFLTLAVVSWCGLAAAAAPSTQDRERARALMDQGDARFEAGSYESALEAYQAADAIMNVPTTGIEVARTFEKLGRLLQAREALQRVAATPVRPDEPQAFAAARQRAERRVAEIGLRVPRVLLKVSGLAAGTEPELSVDGESIPPQKIGATIELNPGSHRLVGRAPGYADVTSDFSLSEGQLREVVLAFGTAPSTTTPAPVGAKGGTPPNTADAAAPRRSRALLWTSLGVAAVGVAVGTVAGSKSLSLTNDVKSRCQGSACPEETRDDISTAKTLANVSNVAFGVSVAALAVGAWQLVVTSGGAKAKASPKQPRVMVGVGSVAVHGAF